MRKWIKLGIAAFGLIAVTGFVACSKKGPAQKAGEKIDKGVDKTKNKIDDAVKSDSGSK